MDDDHPIDDTFIRLVQLIRDDEPFAQTFRALAKLDDLERNLQMTRIATTMRQNAEDPALIACFERLRDKANFSIIVELVAAG